MFLFFWAKASRIFFTSKPKFPWIVIRASPVSRVSPVKFLKYVFRRFKVEKLISALGGSYFQYFMDGGNSRSSVWLRASMKVDGRSLMASQRCFQRRYSLKTKNNKKNSSLLELTSGHWAEIVSMDSRTSLSDIFITMSGITPWFCDKTFPCCVNRCSNCPIKLNDRRRVKKQTTCGIPVGLLCCSSLDAAGVLPNEEF